MTDPVDKPPKENGEVKEETLSQKLGRLFREAYFPPLREHRKGETLSQAIGSVFREAYFPPLRERTMEERMLGFQVMGELLSQLFSKCKR